MIHATFTEVKHCTNNSNVTLHFFPPLLLLLSGIQRETLTMHPSLIYFLYSGKFTPLYTTSVIDGKLNDNKNKELDGWNKLSIARDYFYFLLARGSYNHDEFIASSTSNEWKLLLCLCNLIEKNNNHTRYDEYTFLCKSQRVREWGWKFSVK